MGVVVLKNGLAILCKKIERSESKWYMLEVAAKLRCMVTSPGFVVVFSL